MTYEMKYTLTMLFEAFLFGAAGVVVYGIWQILRGEQ